jgi:hypothetical protein
MAAKARGVKRRDQFASGAAFFVPRHPLLDVAFQSLDPPARCFQSALHRKNRLFGSSFDEPRHDRPLRAVQGTCGSVVGEKRDLLRNRHPAKLAGERPPSSSTIQATIQIAARTTLFLHRE